MNAWIFQGKPERYDLKTEFNAGQNETWLVTRYHEKMGQGDIVFFWRSGARAERGLYGWGRISSAKAKLYDDWGWGIDVDYVERFAPPINVDEVKASGALEGNLLFRMPIGTNFELTDDEFSRLCGLIQNNGLRSPLNV